MISFKLISTFLVLAVNSAHSVELHCEYKIKPYKRSDYYCEGEITTSTSDYIVDTVTGNHISGFGNDQVTKVTFANVSMEVLPKNLKTWFRNYHELEISNVLNFPNFKREMFEEFTHLTYFYFYNLPKITKIPSDAFYEMTQLIHLFIDRMPNLTNLNADLLLKAKYLKFFSARGPNKIDQLNRGFFRNQMTTLQTVDFRETKFVRISYDVLRNFAVLRDARFINSGCLNRSYFINASTVITRDIRANCLDVDNPLQNNQIRKNGQTSSSSSSSSSE